MCFLVAKSKHGHIDKSRDVSQAEHEPKTSQGNGTLEVEVKKGRGKSAAP